MTRYAPLLLSFAAACATRQIPAPTPPSASAGSRPPWDTAFTVAQRPVVVTVERASIDAIVRDGTERSHAVADLAYLNDVIGPRLTPSAAMKHANDWTASKFREYGMDSTWLESWKFGRGWERGSIAVRMTAPHPRWLHAASWAWAPGTAGTVSGDVVYVNATTRTDFDARFAGRLRGKWVLQRGPAYLWNPDGPASTRADSINLDSLKRAAVVVSTPFRDSTNAVLASEGIAGLIGTGGKEFGLLNMSGSPARIYPFPYFVVDNETFGQLHRLFAAGVRTTIEANIQNTFTQDSVVVYNTIAEIRGTELPDEVVLLGAHLDSWDLGTGTTDNATGSIAVLEAARILKASGVRPRRTIQFALFSGEEQGLYGSRKYAQAHATALEKFQAVLVLDNGTGRITGMALQGRNELRDLWRDLFAPVSALGDLHVRAGNKGGTDHLSFVPFSVPAFNFDQESRGYDHTHHSQIDTYDHAVQPDLRQAATVMAATAYELAQLGELLPRTTRVP